MFSKCKPVLCLSRPLAHWTMKLYCLHFTETVFNANLSHSKKSLHPSIAESHSNHTQPSKKKTLLIHKEYNSVFPAQEPSYLSRWYPNIICRCCPNFSANAEIHSNSRTQAKIYLFSFWNGFREGYNRWRFFFPSFLYVLLKRFFITAIRGSAREALQNNGNPCCPWEHLNQCLCWKISPSNKNLTGVLIPFYFIENIINSARSQSCFLLDLP